MKKALLVVSVLALVMVGARSAEAALVLTLSSGGSSVTLSDPTNTFVSYSGTVGSWNINVTTGLGSGALGLGHMDLSSLNVGGSTSSPMTITLQQDGVSVPWNTWTMNFGGTITPGGSVTYTAFAAASTIGVLGPYTGGAFSGMVMGSGGSSSPFTLKQQLVIASNGAFNFTFSGDAELLPLPEPSTLMLLGAGLVGIAGVARRRLRRS